MSGKLRVLAALRSQGARGITRVDFQAPNVIDGLEPILNIPARIYELRHKDGHEIIEVGKRNACTIYRLLRDAQDTQAPRSEMPTEPPAGFGIPEKLERKPRLAIFDDEDWAA